MAALGREFTLGSSSQVLLPESLLVDDARPPPVVLDSDDEGSGMEELEVDHVSSRCPLAVQRESTELDPWMPTQAGKTGRLRHMAKATMRLSKLQRQALAGSFSSLAQDTASIRGKHGFSACRPPSGGETCGEKRGRKGRPCHNGHPEASLGIAWIRMGRVPGRDGDTRRRGPFLVITAWALRAMWCVTAFLYGMHRGERPRTRGRSTLRCGPALTEHGCPV
ncbi:hypothetical protein VTK73DRAFT_1803 [Phialemonium thermophilum]|uniref:Uncharacterized protein n=1 Tax=Phialemonium thermophilum TaxID=223376 RepID=A0ABR3VSX4_9PEZI